MARKKKSSGVKKDSILDELAEMWNEAEAKEGYGELPDGKYQAKITAAEIERSKASGRPQAMFEMQLVSGDHANRKVWKRDGLDNEESMGWFKGGIGRLGFECDTIQELPEVLEEMVGSFCEIQVKTKGEYTNVYFNKALDEDDVEDLEEEDLEEDEEEVEEVEEEEDEDEEEEEDGYEPSKGDEVEVDEYVGTVKTINKKNKTAKVDFGEYGIEEHPWDSLSLVGDDKEEVEEEEDEDEEDEEVEEESAEDAEEEDEDEEASEDVEEGVTLKFKKFTAVGKKYMKSMVKKHEFDAGDYDDDLDLMIDLAEYVGVSGEFKTEKALISAMKKLDK